MVYRTQDFYGGDKKNQDSGKWECLYNTVNAMEQQTQVITMVNVIYVLLCNF